MMGSRSKRWLQVLAGSMPTFLRSLRRTDLLGVLAFFGLISFVVAWEWPRERDTTIEEYDGEIVCFIGDVAPGTKSIRDVPIRNKTSSPLTINSVSRSCSCLATGLDRNTIQPGEAANLKVEFLSPNRQGRFRHQLQVSFTDGEDPIIVRLLGTVSAWIRSNVPVLEFGDTYPGEASRQLLRLKVREAWPEEQRRIKSLMPHTRIESVATEDDGKTVAYTIAFHPPAGNESKECEGDLVIDWIGHDDRGFKLPCKGKVVSEWSAEPPQVVLGKVSMKKPPSFTVEIRNQRYPEESWRHCKVIAVPSEMLDASATWDNGKWKVTATVRTEGLLHPGVKSAALCIAAPDSNVPFRVRVYWDAQQ